MGAVLIHLSRYCEVFIEVEQREDENAMVTLPSSSFFDLPSLRGRNRISFLVW